MNKLSVIFVTDSLNAKHGVAKAGFFILKALGQYTGDLTICSNDNSYSLDKLFTNKIPVNYIAVPAKPLFRVGVGVIGPKTILRWLKVLYTYFSWLLRKKKLTSDFIFVNGQYLSFPLYARIINHSHGKKILIVHESPRHSLSSHLVSLDEAIDEMRLFDALIFVSSRCQTEWTRHLNIADIPSYYIPNCADEETAKKLLSVSKSTVKDTLKLPQDATVIICVGSIQPRKGQDILIDNIAPILHKNRHMCLYLVGSDMGGWILQLKKKIKQQNLTSQIHFVSFQTNAMSWIYAADLLVVPSRAEAMPLVILEAMSLKTPVLASNIDGIPELIKDKTTGWLFDPERPDTFQAAMLHLLDPAIRSKVASNAHKYYWDNFSQNKLSLRYKKALQQLMLTN